MLNHSVELNLFLLLLGPEVIELNDKPTEPQEKVSIHLPELGLGRSEDGLPLLPPVDAEEIAMKDVKRLLAEYVALSWSTCFNHDR